MSRLRFVSDFQQQLKMQLLAFLFFLTVIQTDGQQLEIVPNATERVVDSGSHFTVTCIYQYVNEYDKRENNISWILPNYLTKNPVKSKEYTFFFLMSLRNFLFLNSVHLEKWRRQTIAQDIWKKWYSFNIDDDPNGF